MFTHVDSAKKFAKRLQRLLKESGCEVALTTSQKITARSWQYKDWFHLQNAINHTPNLPDREVIAQLLQQELDTLKAPLNAREILDHLVPDELDVMILHEDGAAFVDFLEAKDLLASGQPALAEFRSGEAHVILKLVRYRTHTPTFLTACLGQTTREDENRINHPLFRKSRNRRAESWFTPDFREYCQKLGFNPDAGRPHYPDNNLADRLIRAAQYALWPSGMALKHIYCFELLIAGLDVLAVDQVRLKADTARNARKFSRWLFQDAPQPRWWHDDSPRDALLEELQAHDLLDACKVAADILLALDDTAPLIVDGFVAPFHLLPSEYGIGCQPSLYGLPGTPEWLSQYSFLQGVALLPDFDPDDLVTLAAYRELKGIGMVRFLNREEAQAYLDGEGRKWINHWPVARVPEGLSAPERRSQPIRRVRTWLHHLWGRAE